MINVGIFGFGNVAKGIVENIQFFKDINLVAIFSRHAGGQYYCDIPILGQGDITRFKNKIDVMLICVGSRIDVPKYSNMLAEIFNTVDCYDDHKSIKKYIKKIDASAKKANKTSIVATGWDPGLFSLARCLLDSILPNGNTQTFWGKGISQGHSEAIRKINGVLDARQYTIPNKRIIKQFEHGNNINFSDAQKHLRLCYIACKDGADKNSIKQQVKNIPHYFKGYKTKIKFVDRDIILKKHNKLFHAGFVERISMIGTDRYSLKLALKTDSNPNITASIMLAYARAAYRLNKENRFGAYTVLDIPIKYICDGASLNFI